MRLFAAISLSPAVCDLLEEQIAVLRSQGSGTFTRPENLHLTLAFIGETDNPDQVKDALKGISYKPFKLSLSEMGTFGDLLWVGMKGNQGLSAAAKAVRDALDAAGIPYDRKAFTPHITIIRKSSGSWKQVQPPRGQMMVKSISLMKTTFKDGKPVYSEVCSF